MSSQSQQYDKRGVSAGKEEVHEAVKNLDKGLYAKTFSRIYPDFLGNDETFCNLMSSDGTGTKSIIAYLYWKETGDLSVWENIAVDALVMNLDDLLCVGATGPFIYTSIINRNKHLIPGEVIAAIIRGAQNFMNTMQHYGIDIKYMGGETADLGDSVRTITIDGSMTARMAKKDLIITSNIKPGQVIVGLASYGKALYENEYNSGIGSNGLTSARHDVLSKDYFKYTESFDPNTDKAVQYIGTKNVTDALNDTPLNVGKALLSPTKTYAPVLKKMLEEHRIGIHSLVHCTGGAQSKVLHFAEKVKIVKNNLFATPPLFSLIQQESGTSWQEMYKVFNMGHRMEMYVDENKAESLIGIAKEFNIDAQIIGRIEAAETASVELTSEHGTFIYK